jgi:hypothetical protein
MHRLKQTDLLLVQEAQKIKDTLGFIGPYIIMRRLKLTLKKTIKLMKYLS